jgi:autotransporter-associated beta strand protein
MTIIDSSAPPSLPTGTTILAVVNATTLTLSQNATATSTTDSLIFETRNTFSGGTILNAGSLTLACNSWQYYSSPYSSPSNAWGLGTGPITLNGGTLTLLGHTVDTRYLSGALPNDLIVPAGKTAPAR